MSEMMMVRETALRWDTAETQVTYYCRKDRIDGAQKIGGVWMIPGDARKPEDRRGRRASAAVRTDAVRKPMPIGVSNYRDASTNYYYVDKTLIIRGFLDERPKVSLFTRPRRFGKTLNMDMLRTFFEISGEDTTVYFRDKKIWACGEYYQSYQGNYPVIYLSFKDVKCDTWEETYEKIVKLISAEFRRHGALESGSALSEYEKEQCRLIANGNARGVDYENSLATLSMHLHKHHDGKAMIIIDEYDTPIQQGYTCDFYTQIVNFVWNLFSGGLKDNDDHLSFGFLTGILRVAKESIFSGLNNLKINSILDEKYSSYFGFMPDEVRRMATDWGVRRSTMNFASGMMATG